MLFDFLERFSDQRIDAGGPVAPAAGRDGLKVFGQVVQVEPAVGVDHDHAFDRVFQLADVARPGIGHQHLAHGRRDGRDRLAVRGGEFLEEVLDQERDVVAPLAQGGSLTLTTLRR